MNRYTAYDLIETLNQYSNMKIYDIYSVRWTDFNFPNGYTKYSIKKDETQKPYLIAYRTLGTTNYWDVLLFINGVIDVLNLKAGDELKIPKKGDMETFIKSIIG